MPIDNYNQRMGRKPKVSLDDLTPEQQEEISRRVTGRKSRQWWQSLTSEQRAEITAAGRAKANAMRPKGTAAAKKHTEAARAALARAVAERRALKEAAGKKAAE